MTDERTTSIGTPWATTWDEAWAARVDGAESALGRRICGARTLSGDPCTLGSDHPTGRCRYHGGTDAIGAPIGNQNARTHGLYARRLQRCGTHCPMWEHCPFAGDDVLALDPRERPICAYEAEEYEAVLDGMGGAGCASTEVRDDDCSETTTTRPSPDLPLPSLALPDDCDELTIHNLALMQVMLSRAAAALSVTALTDTTTSEGERYQLHTTKMNPALQAFLRISRELRATLNDTRRAAHVVAARVNASNDASDACAAEDPSWIAQIDDSVLERVEAIGKRTHEADAQREEYIRRLEWIAHDKLGAQWREFEPISEFAVPRGVRDPGAPTHNPLVSTLHPPPNDHPPPLRDTDSAQYAQPP